MSEATHDVEVIDQGTIVLFQPLSEACRDWIEENVQEDALWFCGLVVEHRYAGDLIDGMVEAGLTYRGK